MGNPSQPALLYFSTSSKGGIADYAQEQVKALTSVGVSLTVLSPKGVQWPEMEGLRIIPLLEDQDFSNRSKISKLVASIAQTRRNISTLKKVQAETGISKVLFSSYFEYFSPFWAGMLRSMQSRGVLFGTVIHDPIRDAVVGPSWWHRWSVGQAYSFIGEAFAHDEREIDIGHLKQRPFSLSRVPHGTYEYSFHPCPYREARQRLNIPQEARVFLAFGHIRDNKNLDLFIRALTDFPSARLIVAGRSLSASQKPVTYYKELAQELGVASRIHWVEQFIPEEDISIYFGACDHVLLTYSSGFRSASGVLGLAGHFRKPVLASSGPSPLQDVVQEYQLGTFVEADSEDAIRHGIRKVLSSQTSPDWERYLQEESWENNARIIQKRLIES